MKLVDLFSGIGGFSLTASWLGWETVQFVEIDAFCQKILKKHWPDIPIHSDIKTFDGTKFKGSVDIVCGGFPCQGFSLAGKRKGTADDRYLWPEMLRVIREVQPCWVVGENVYGLVNWSGGLVFEQVQTDLENEGYEVTSYILPACAVNAPHRRDRIWFVPTVKTHESSRTIQWENGKPVNKSYTTGKKYGINLNQLATIGLLPTPTESDSTGGRTNKNPRKGRNPLTNNLMDAISYIDKTGKTSQLNPLFVTEMMGYPIDWLTSPFLSGEMNQ